MKLKKLCALALAAALAISALPLSASAAKNPKKNADDMDIPAILQTTDEKGTVNVYHWWTAGGEKNAIESVVDGFKSVYSKIKAKSNAIPGGARRRYGDEGEGIAAGGKKP